MPSPTVKIAFDLTLAGGGDFFTIGATPIGGTAVSGAFPIAGDVLTDITADVRSITTRRGRSRGYLVGVSLDVHSYCCHQFLDSFV